MKGELGRFSWEIVEVLKGLEFYHLLKDIMIFLRDGIEQGKKNFLKQKGLATALHLATIEQILPYWEIVSWVEEYQKAHR